MIEFRDVGLQYRKHPALQGVSFTLQRNTICGLLGRNGAGKTSLMGLLAAFRRPTAGAVRVLGEDPYENPKVTRQVAFIYNRNEDSNTFKVREQLQLAAAFRPNWDAAYANRLLERFEISPKKTMKSLSLGMRAAVHVTIGLASRAPLTIYDETYLGMDAANRHMFVSELLADYLEHPRTILFSTHYISEMEHLMNEVLVIGQGRLLYHEDIDTLRTRGTALTGPAELVARFAANRTVLSDRSLGTTREAVLLGTLDDADKTAALAAGLSVTQPSLQDLFIHLTQKGV
jgi:ABC-2 type transport system ATP-binding protein